MLELNIKDAVANRLYHSPPMETMGQRIKRLRESRGWGQEYVATQCGVTVSAVSQWELDTTKNVKLVPFLKLARLFGTDVHYLVFGSDRGASEFSKLPISGKQQPKS